VGPQSFNIGLHVIAGVMGLSVGVVPLFSRKGSALHRKGGKWFLGFACIGLATAIIGDIFFQPALWLYAVTCAFAYDLIAGLRALKIRCTGPRLIDNLLAFGALAVAAVLLRAGLGQKGGLIVVSTSSYLAAMAVYDLSRPLWRSLWKARVWPVDHGIKMTAAYFAMASAGAGNLLRGLQPFSQLAPSAIGAIIMITFAIWYLARRPAAVRVMQP
jgi:hypothetical protein